MLLIFGPSSEGLTRTTKPCPTWRKPSVARILTRALPTLLVAGRNVSVPFVLDKEITSFVAGMRFVSDTRTEAVIGPTEHLAGTAIKWTTAGVFCSISTISGKLVFLGFFFCG